MKHAVKHIHFVESPSMPTKRPARLIGAGA